MNPGFEALHRMNKMLMAYRRFLRILAPRIKAVTAHRDRRLRRRLDGHRSLLLLGIVPGLAALMPRPAFFHDALVTARKLYTETELELFGRLAAPDADVIVGTSGPGYSVLQVPAISRP